MRPTLTEAHWKKAGSLVQGWGAVHLIEAAKANRTANREQDPRSPSVFASARACLSHQFAVLRPRANTAAMGIARFSSRRKRSA